MSLIVISYSDIADFFVPKSIFPYPLIFHLEFWYDPIAADRCFFATRQRRP